MWKLVRGIGSIERTDVMEKTKVRKRWWFLEMVFNYVATGKNLEESIRVMLLAWTFF